MRFRLTTRFWVLWHERHCCDDAREPEKALERKRAGTYRNVEGFPHENTSSVVFNLIFIPPAGIYSSERPC
jgi:hypothetical protein